MQSNFARSVAKLYIRVIGLGVAQGQGAKTVLRIFGGSCTFMERETSGQLGERCMVETIQNESRLSASEQRQLSLSAGCTDPHWLQSFLYHCCTDPQDARNTIACLQRNCAQKFQRVQRAKPKPKRPEPEWLSWSTVNALVREAAPVDRKMLSSYLRWATSERSAYKTIDVLYVTHPEIWQVCVTPRY